MLTFYKLATFDPELRRRIAEAEAQVKADPSVKEQNSGVYPKGHVTIQGLGITIETAQGQWRRGVSKDGTPWEVKLSNSYGYIKGTDSAEPGDQMDVFLGPDPELEIVFVVDQNKGDTDVFDEHKCVMGCRTASQAKQLYMTNYSVGWKGFRSITPLTIPQFKAWLATGDMKAPLAGQQMASFYKVARVLPGQKKEKDRATVRSRLFNAMPVAAGGALAGGGLLELLRRSVFPAETVEDLQRFSEQAKLEKVMGHNLAFNAEQRPFQDLANYSVQGNRMLNNKVLGADPLALVKLIRSGPWMPEKARWQSDSGLHYDAFKKGPLSGGMRLLSELTTGWAPGNVPPAAVQGPELRDALMQAANADVAKQTGVQNYFDWKVGKPELWHHDAMKPDRLTTAQQIQVMRGWPAGLKANMPEAIKPQLDALGNTLTASDAPLRAGYNSITQPFLLANSTMRNVAAGLAGAGVLGLGAYGVGRYLDSRKDLERKKRREVTATEHAMQFVPTLKQAAINGKALAGILAALGVGGYGVKKVGDGVASAGQFLASPEGQKVLAVHPGLRRALGVEFPHMDVNLGLDPTGTITGAAMGAGIGALTGVMHKEDEERPWWKSPTAGALIGAGLGGLYDYASMRGAQEMWNLQPKEQQDLLGMSGSRIRAGRQAVIN